MRDLRTEDEIIANWKDEIDQPVVSICCITYNHEPYIEDALEGFLIQETDFPFEILIHDDASTDQTADIIREYEAKYPRLIKPIYQVENQFSKGIRMNPEFNFPRAKGEYIALCEGDDYWVSKDKLQKQYNYMLNNANVSLTFHKALVVRDNKVIDVKAENFSDQQFFSIEDLLDSWFICTQTIMLKKSVMEGMETYFNGVINGDWSIQLVAGHNGDVVYLENIEAAYRKHNTSLSKNVGKNKTYRAMKLIKLFTSFDQYSKFSYRKKIEEKIEFYLSEHHKLLTEERCRYSFYLGCPLILMKKIIKKLKKRIK